MKRLNVALLGVRGIDPMIRKQFTSLCLQGVRHDVVGGTYEKMIRPLVWRKLNTISTQTHKHSMDHGYSDIKHRHMVNTNKINNTMFSGTMYRVRNHVYTELELPIKERILNLGNSVGLNTKSHFENRPIE